MTSEAFQKAYQALNPRQKEAVDAIEGPVVVAAGPGTGKTQVLALRIANILLKTDTKPENILCLTFTESGTVAMRRRLAELVGPSAYKIVINTFHGFCNDIIKNHPEDFPTIIGCTNITDVEQIRLVEELLTTLPLQKLTTVNEPFYYLKDIQAAINKLKQEGITPADFTAGLTRIEETFWRQDDLYSTRRGYEGKLKSAYQGELAKLEKNKELAVIYQSYAALLRTKKYYDYSDMILEVRTALEHDRDLLLLLQETYQYILVDEHQDTNNAQNRVLELLASFYDQPNLFVVGDEKQAIFRFQGASLENFLYLKEKYPQALAIALEDNYRSSQAILDSAHRLLPGVVRLTARRGEENRPIRCGEFSTRAVEEYFIVHDIKEKLAAGVPAEEIAILYRQNRDAFALAAMLEKIGVSHTIESSQDILADHDVRKLLVLLRAIHHFGDDHYLAPALHIDFLGLDPLDVFKLIAWSSRSKTKIHDALKHPQQLSSQGIEGGEKLNQFYRQLVAWKKQADNEDATVVFSAVVRESGLLTKILAAPAGVEKVDKINTLFAEVKAVLAERRGAMLADFIAHLDLLEAHEIYLKKTLAGVQTGRVRLLTAHGAKGLEFDYVYLAYANDRHWGNRQRREKISLPAEIFSLTGRPLPVVDTNDDERRLFYVALTRAKKEVTITAARQGDDKKELLPTMFIGELDPALIVRIDPAATEEHYRAAPGLVYAGTALVKHGVRDRDFVRELFINRGLAVTHLNNYLTCPWKYFYLNLLRLPAPVEPYLLYGTAVHAALQAFFNRFQEEGEASVEALLLPFQAELSRQPLSAKEFSLYQERGEKALAGWHQHYQPTWTNRLLTEMAIHGVSLDDIPLTGKIDKVEFLNDQGEVNVVDYKTGLPKSRAQIEGGADEEGSGSIKRQLVFYQLLLSLHEGGKYKMVSGEIDFVEPNKSGYYKKERFVVAPEEVEALKELIKKTAVEILNLDFWDKRCDDKKCQYCSLRAMLN